MKAPIKAVVWIVVTSRSLWKIRTSEILGSTIGFPLASASLSRCWRASQTGLSLTPFRIQRVKNAGMMAIQNIARHPISGLPSKMG